MSMSAPRLTGVLGRLSQSGHGGAALLLVREWGGTKRYVPSVPRPGSPLVELVGMAAAQALAALAGGQHIDVPSRAALEASRKGEVLRAEGSTREVALALGCTERYVRMVRAADGQTGWRKPRRRPARDERQTDLEEWLRGR